MEMKVFYQKIRSVKLCLIAHPDNEEGSEFADRIRDLEEIMGYVEKYMKAIDEDGL